MFFSLRGFHLVLALLQKIDNPNPNLLNMIIVFRCTPPPKKKNNLKYKYINPKIFDPNVAKMSYLFQPPNEFYVKISILSIQKPYLHLPLSMATPYVHHGALADAITQTCHLWMGITSWESKGTPPQSYPPALLRDYENPLVSLNSPLIRPYFLGWHRGGTLRFP